jgi:hypothetical protein
MHSIERIEAAEEAVAVVAETPAAVDEVETAVAVDLAAEAAVATAAVGAAARDADHGVRFMALQHPHARMRGFAKYLIQERKTWPSNARFRSSNPTLSRRT